MGVLPKRLASQEAPLSHHPGPQWGGGSAIPHIHGAGSAAPPPHDAATACAASPPQASSGMYRRCGHSMWKRGGLELLPGAWSYARHVRYTAWCQGHSRQLQDSFTQGTPPIKYHGNVCHGHLTVPALPHRYPLSLTRQFRVYVNPKG
jgi:hypothetical protein